ncbi:alpha/beta hydrolase [Microbacterium horticulturae]|uniref:Alpha/beta hydrolase n=1 Tax=Microbacterium horticulturae TaxID=3028316 RepID=A0ABY8C3N0_9MICO|nr:alpha/beta hydrolase [Microbacterium sp. KACC 23027]WEG10692.1 alpha/beta hydrolase [Microbacterium sp. KACC 23027]
MDDDFDEFAFLPAQAAENGIDGALPRGERLNLTLEDGRTLSALRWAPASTPDAAPQVTFLHGAGLNAHTWDTTILALGLPALAIDLPGHGDSSWRDDAAYVAPVLAPDVATALRAWTDGPQLLVGQSLGGLVAAAVAASTPELVRELVVIDITPGIDPAGNAQQIAQFFAGPTNWASRDELVQRALSFGLGGSPAAAERGVFLNSRMRPDGRVEWKHHFAHLAAMMAAHPEATPATAVLDETGWDDLAAVTAPITLVRGEHGFVTDAEAADFAARLPAARQAVLTGGHNLQEDAPVALGRLLAQHGE